MPTYDYFCETNSRKLEVNHKMSENLATWGELCERAGMESGDTPAEAPIKRLATGGHIINSSSRSDPAPACASGACCPGGMCGLPE